MTRSTVPGFTVPENFGEIPGMGEFMHSSVFIGLQRVLKPPSTGTFSNTISEAAEPNKPGVLDVVVEGLSPVAKLTQITEELGKPGDEQGQKAGGSEKNGPSIPDSVTAPLKELTSMLTVPTATLGVMSSPSTPALASAPEKGLAA